MIIYPRMKNQNTQSKKLNGTKTHAKAKWLTENFKAFVKSALTLRPVVDVVKLFMEEM